jgi:hypothetical protein
LDFGIQKSSVFFHLNAYSASPSLTVNSTLRRMLSYVLGNIFYVCGSVGEQIN